MKQNGQLFSLDFLVAMGLIVLLLGTTIQWMNRFAFESHEQFARTELERAGQTAAILLVSNPKTTCQLYANAPPSRSLETNVNNCIDTTKISALNASGLLASELGLTTDYGFHIRAGTTEIGTLPSGTTPIFSTGLNGIVHNGNLNKSDLYRCIKKQPSCALTSEVILFQTWKN